MEEKCVKLKRSLEEAFSMPFVVSSSIVDEEEQYTCYPFNEDSAFFTVKAYIHNLIRLVVEVGPQKNAGSMLYEMAHADAAKQKVFFQYIDILCKEKAKIVFSVNGDTLSSKKPWPENWRYFKCRVDIVPIPDFADDRELIDLLVEWVLHGTSLILSLLTIEESSSVQKLTSQQEGEVRELNTKRYERSRVNREICLSHKGYSCYVCGFNFMEKYGQIGKDYIEVHHTTPVSKMGENYSIDIDRDLVPVCSNCHSMLHKKEPPYTIEELKEIIAHSGGNIEPYSPKRKNIQIFSKYKPNCIPLYTLRAACGYFEEGGIPEVEGWVDASGHGFTPDIDRHFAIHAKGDSMTPKIHDGDYCVFEWYKAGSRNEEIVLTQSSNFDPDYGGEYTIKKYHSEMKQHEDGSWEQEKIELIPLNKKYNSIELDKHTEYRTIGVFKCVL